MTSSGASDQFDQIAIVGMSVRFPGARNVEEYWRNLREGVESIRFFSDEELRAEGVAEELLRRDQYVRARAVVDEVEYFDAEFFGITAREAEIMDPQHRLFLECSWEALENAGYNTETFDGRIGLYAGVGVNSYFYSNISNNRALIESAGVFPTLMGNDKDFLPTRVSYKLNLRGPSLSVQTACSTSLVATHLACQSLLNGECDMALAGGVSVTFPQNVGYVYQEGGINSPDGHCRTFDALAQGTVGGNGAGIVVLKRLSEALASGDHIYAVIKGSAINNDGANKIGYTAPSIDGQAEVIAEALSIAEVEPDTISYIEAHGTATPLGDPIEVAALTQVFRASTERQQFCALGSVKSNMGHLDTAAGVAGLIKTALSLHHRELPPSLHFQEANPQIDFKHSPFYVNTGLRRWECEGQPLRAGVSSFGIGGTNAHVVLEEAPQRSERVAEQGEGWQVVPLSARSPEALQRMSKALAEHLRQHAEVELSDVAFSLQVGRRHFGHRLAIVGRDRKSVIAGLEDWETGRVLRGQSGEGVRGERQSEARSREVGFMFSGQGAQYVGMGRGLYEREPVFRRTVDECAAKLKSHMGGVDLRQVLFAESADAKEQLRRTEWAQPALFVVEYALAQLWMSWGVKPAALIGHSVGEYVAACVAGVLELEEALFVVALRGRLMQQMASGAMLAVGMSEGEVERWLAGRQELEVAAVNAGNAVVVAGVTAAVARAERELAAEGVLVRRLETSHAFHTELMEPMRAEFEQALRGVRWREPQVRYVSNVTGQWITAEESSSPSYWSRHVRERVRFGAGVELLLSAGIEVLLEVGPGRVLSGLARQVARERSGSGPSEAVLVTSLPALGEAASDEEHLSGSVARLWSSGVNIDWESRQAQRERSGRRVPLPGYAFERKRYWVEPSTEVELRVSKDKRESDPARWFYAPVWKQVLGAGKETVRGGRWLVFVDERGIGKEIAGRLVASGAEVVRVARGAQWQELSATEYRLRQGKREDYERLLKRVRESGGGELPERVVHLWGVSGEDGEAGEAEEHWLSLLYLAQALGEQELSRAVEVMVVTAGLYNVSGKDRVRAAQATVLGPCRVIPQEYVSLRCRVIDLSLAEVRAQASLTASSEWLDELVSGLQTTDEMVGEVAYRNGRWWVESFAPITLTDEVNTDWIRAGGTYLITGGLGGVGLAMAARLAQQQTRLVLLGRTEFPPRSHWEQIVTADEGDAPELKEKLKQLLALEQAGATVHVWAADVADLGSMQEVIKRVRDEVGPLHGVVHAAGIGGGGVMQLLPVENVRATLAAKVQGTDVLAKVLKEEEELEWVVLCSSQRSLLGGVGRMDYCAANAYLDAYAHEWQQQKAKGRWRVVTINWDTWRETGMAVETAARLGVEPVTEGLSTSEGIEAWSRIMSGAGRLPQVIVSTKEFQSQVETARQETAARLAAASEQEALETAGETTPGSSGRHPRPALSTPYEAGRTAAETELARIWAEALGIEQVGIHDNFFELGGDSVLSLQITARANQAGLRLTPRQVFERQTVAELASVAGEGTSSAAVQYEQGEVIGEVPLMPIQQWFLDQEWSNPHHYNQAVLLAVRERLEPEALREVVKALLAHHDGLRLRYEQQPNGEWEQQMITTAAALEQGGWFEEVEIKGGDEAEQSAQIEAVAAQTQRELHLTTGPLLRVVHMRLTAKDEERLLLVVHHLAMDAISWRVLLEDLARGYEQARQGEPVSFAAKTMSFKQWAETIAAHVAGGGVDEETPYWTEVRERRAAMKRLPVDDTGGQNRVADEQVVRAELNADETRRLLVEVPQTHHTQITEVLLAGLVQAIGEWTGERRVAVEVEGHGRDEVVEGADVSRTVGWFTTQYPVVLEVEGARSTGEVLAQVKREMRRIPGSGMGYGLLKYLGTNEEEWQREPEIGFLYLGQVDQVLQQSGPLLPATEGSGASQSEENPRPHLLDLTAVVSGGRLQLTWVYSDKLHHAQTIQQLAAHYLSGLRDIIDTTHSLDALSVSDFPHARLTQSELDDLLRTISNANGDSSIEDIYPLSPVQQGMLFHTLYAPESGVYFQQSRSSIVGQLDTSAFRQAWQRVAERHPVIRTAMFWQNRDRPLQVVWRKIDVPWQQLDWRGLSQSEQEDRLNDLMEADRMTSFDLNKAPLMRCMLIQVAEDTHEFVWSHHHLLLDGWSAPLLVKEVIAFYEAISRGQSLQLKQPRPYLDYIRWLQQSDLSEAEAFWKRKLKGFKTPTRINLDPGPQDPNSETVLRNEYRSTLPEETVVVLQQITRQRQLTFNTLMQGVWALLLSYYSNETDVVFGAVVSGRPAELVDVESMIGMFINTLPVRIRVEPEQDLMSWLRVLQEEQAEMQQYEYSPLVQVQRWSEVNNARGLFDSVLVFENYPVALDPGQQHGSVRVYASPSLDSTHYPLSITAWPKGELRFSFSYDARHFNPLAITRMAENINLLLKTIATDSGVKLRDLISVLAREEEQQRKSRSKELDKARLEKLKQVKRRTARV